ncbi:MAG: HD domain-containing phosphohydrolase [Candidatus Omnitrophota bacterium]
MRNRVRSPEKIQIAMQGSILPIENYLPALNNIGLGISIIDTQMRVLWSNETQTRIFGSDEQHLGKHCYWLYRRLRNTCKFCPAKKSIETGKTQTEEMKILINGSYKYFLVTASPIKNDQRKVMYVVKAVQDMTLIGKRENEEINLIKRLGHTNQKLNSTLLSLENKSSQMNDLNKKITLLNGFLKRKVLHKAKDLQALNKELMVIYETGKTITSTPNKNEIFDIIVQIACKVTNGKASMLRLFDKKEEKLNLRAAYGFEKTLCERYGSMNVTDTIYGRLAKNDSASLLENIANDPRLSREHRATFRKKGLNTAIIVPLYFYDELLGTLTIFYSKIHNSMKTEKIALQALAAEVAMILKNSQLHENINKSYLDTINTLVMTLEARDSYTQGHSERVTHYSICIAKKMGLSEKQIEIMRYAAKLHDIGKIAVPDIILNKPGKLSITEKTQVQMHPLKGAEILSSVKFLGAGMDLIKYHHERYDGKGYPEGRLKENIPIIARIASVADAFDAMTSDRPYRKKLSVTEAIEEIKKGCGTQFDPVIAKAFLNIVDKNLLTEGAFIS